MKITAAAALLSALCFARAVSAQILTTGETLGKNRQAIMFSGNWLFVDSDKLNIAYLQYIRGLNERFDFYLSAGGTRIYRENQEWVGIGGNLRLFRVEKVNVSGFNIFSVPVHRRSEASTVLLNSAIVVSRNITERVALYSGINSLWPIGARERGVFTPPTKKINVPLGIGVFWGRWGIFTEGDFGRLKGVGIGISKTF
jgi:hypothetical protein